MCPVVGVGQGEGPWVPRKVMGMGTHPNTKTSPAAAPSPTGKEHSTASSMATGATEKPKNPSSEQMAASATVCPCSWDTWAASHTERQRWSQKCPSLDPRPCQALSGAGQHQGWRGHSAHTTAGTPRRRRLGMSGSGVCYGQPNSFPTPGAPHSHPLQGGLSSRGLLPQQRPRRPETSGRGRS